VTLAACHSAAKPTTPPVADDPTTPTKASPARAPRSVGDIVAQSDLPATVGTPLAGDEMGVTIHRLSNGMTVYISTDRQKPRFSAWIGTRAGSRHDPANSTGLAHYLEHMLFKGTDDYGTLDAKAEAPHVQRVAELYDELRETDNAARRKAIFKSIDQETQQQAKYAVPNEISRTYSSLGIEGTNAFTSNEQTVYIGDIPANRLQQWAKLEGERFADPVFRLFYPELEAVYEEKNLSMDRPSSRLFQTLELALFPEHPYGTQPTIGLVDHLKTPAYGDMVEYFKRWYVPNNMAIVLAGDIDAKTALPVLEAAFGGLKPKLIPATLPGKIVPLKGRVARTVLADGEESTWLAWPTVEIAHKDKAALAVMDLVLDDARVGLLNVELELTQKVPSAGSWNSNLREAGYFSVTARARQGQTPEQLEQLLLGVIGKLKAGEFSQADVDSAKLSKQVSRKRQLEWPQVRASRMMSSFVTHRSWDAVLAADKAFDAVSRADIIGVANKYLGDNFVAVHRKKGAHTIAKIEKPTITPVEIDPSRESPFITELMAMKTPLMTPEWVVEGQHYAHKKLRTGTMIAAKNTRNDTFSVTYRMDRGYRKEPLLCYALDLFEISGGAGLSAEKLQKELYALGSQVYTTCNAERSAVVVSGLDSKQDETLALLDKWIAAPSFDDAMLERHLDNVISERRDELEEDRTLTSALDQYAKFGRDSAWLQQPSNAKLARAKPVHLAKLITGWFDYRHRTLYFGPRDAEMAAEAVVRGSGRKRTGPTQTRHYRHTKASEIYFLHKEVAKANVRFVMPRGPLPREQRPAALLFSEYLSGSMSSLVFQEIRESRGLAYSAYSRFTWGSTTKDESGLLGYMSTQADKVPVAVETFLGLLRAEDIAPERIASAKASLDQGYRSSRIDPRWVVSWVEDWDELGEKSDPRAWEWKSVQKLALADAKKFAKQFRDTPVVVAIVGDRDRVGLEALGKIGKVNEVKAASLFSYGAFPEKKASKPAAGKLRDRARKRASKAKGATSAPK
ncbi:MAG: insulinase family protein, partial [Nannocystaceae bacterium]|nr:insulinase family protein [Nannocystaceae bacterium]